MPQYIRALRYNKTEAKFKSHYIHKRFLCSFLSMTMVYQLRKTTESATIHLFNSTRNQVDEEPLCGCATCKSLFIYLFIYVAIAFVLELRLQWDNQLPEHLRHCTVFWLKWPIDDLLLVIPPPPRIKVSSIRKSCSELWEKQLWMDGRREVSIISHRPVTSSDLKQFVGVSYHFCNWLQL